MKSWSIWECLLELARSRERDRAVLSADWRGQLQTKIITMAKNNKTKHPIFKYRSKLFFFVWHRQTQQGYIYYCQATTLMHTCQCCHEYSNYSNIRIVFHEYYYSYSYSCHFEDPNIIRIFEYLPPNSTNICCNWMQKNKHNLTS